MRNHVIFSSLILSGNYLDLSPNIDTPFPTQQNKIVHLSTASFLDGVSVNCSYNSACNASLFFMITTDVELNTSVVSSAKNLNANIAASAYI